MERILLGVIVVFGTVPLTAAECHCNTTDACTVFPSAPCSQVGNPDSCQVGWFGAYCQKLQERNNGMEILVGSQMCYNWSSTEHPPPKANVICRQPLTGNTVTIRLPGGPGVFLTLCEVQIFVCSDGWFGTNCDKQCRCLKKTEVCDKNTGLCLGGCASGYTGIGCQTICSDGWFGTNCDKQCRCLNNTEVCDKITGQCLGGCAPRNSGMDCQINVTEEVLKWGLPAAITLGTLLTFTVIGATIYIKRLMKQLEDLKTKMPEEHYVGLDEMTTDCATCNTYEQRGNEPYYINVN